MPGSDTSLSEKNLKAYPDEKIEISFSGANVDTAAELAAGSDEPLDPADALRVR